MDGQRPGRHAARPVLRPGFETLGSLVHDGRAHRRREPRERSVHVRERAVRARFDAAARRRPVLPEVPVPDRTDRLLRPVVPDRGGPADARLLRVDRRVRPILVVDEPSAAHDQGRLGRVPVAQAHGPADHQPAQVFDHHHSYITTKRTDRIFTPVSV